MKILDADEFQINLTVEDRYQTHLKKIVVSPSVINYEGNGILQKS